MQFNSKEPYLAENEFSGVFDEMYPRRSLSISYGSFHCLQMGAFLFDYTIVHDCKVFHDCVVEYTKNGKVERYM